MEQEVWRDVVGYEGIYQVSDKGRVKSLPRRMRKKELILTSTSNGTGYMIVNLYKDKKRKSHLVHRLVLSAFNPVEDSNNLEVNHKNFETHDNRLSNLEWCTKQENMDHYFSNNRERDLSSNSGENHHLSKFTDEEVIYIRKAYATGQYKISEIAEWTFSSEETIRMIVKGLTWKHLL